MERVEGKPLAEKPNFSSVLRCRWGEGRRFSQVFVVAVGMQVARAMAYLHDAGICHGDLYAHNVLVDDDGKTTVCDFGASFFYSNGPRDECCRMFEGVEVRAFGLLLKDLAVRGEGCDWILE
ncbi:unnamed protein product, partial [Discosporangium mesarthrocarpum]